LSQTAIDRLFKGQDTPRKSEVSPLNLNDQSLADMEVRSISLRDSLGAVSFVSTGDIVASRLCCDSRLVQPGDVFVALRGSNVDGHLHLESAVAKGAVGVVVDRPSSRISVPQCVVADTRAAFARICLDLIGAPQKSIRVNGVTGTNGKSTTTWLMRSVLEAAGRKTGLLGTLEYFDGRLSEPAVLTTPDSEQIARYLAQMARNDVTECVLEISSHALHQQRCAGITLANAAITNITQDHFDYHGDLTKYRAAKSQIASLLVHDGALLLGIDDEGCRAVRGQFSTDRRIVTFGFHSGADLRVEQLQASASGQLLQLHLHSSSFEVQTKLVGRHNALNILAAAGLAEQSGIASNEIHVGLERAVSVPGRMERIDVGQQFSVFIDYAHTPDGIRQCVATAKTLTAGRVILVFGAGGDRDRSKRPLMAMAAKNSDIVLVTSDNPRSEKPDLIIADIVTGFDSTERVLTFVDRQQGIREALQLAEPGDVVVIAGRGHEKNQQIGDRRICFDDRRVTRRLLLELLTGMSHVPPTQRSAIPA
jgi:UDP-N-acetylmuramoyl-L-alanyl-D-glutamate--2,6-diaminopimelate ligase